MWRLVVSGRVTDFAGILKSRIDLDLEIFITRRSSLLGITLPSTGSICDTSHQLWQQQDER
jgi:hypothetical protein